MGKKTSLNISCCVILFLNYKSVDISQNNIKGKRQKANPENCTEMEVDELNYLSSCHNHRERIIMTWEHSILLAYPW